MLEWDGWAVVNGKEKLGIRKWQKGNGTIATK